MELEHAINSILPTYFHVAFQVPMIPVETTTPSVVKQLHEKNIPTLALTARSLHIADRTLDQLANMGIHLSIPHIQQKEMFLTLPTHIPSMYKQGILFSGSNNKGDVLLEFFKEANYYPKMVIFVDDKRKYLEQVEKTLETKAIPFIGVRYGGCDERVKNFDPIEAEYELAQFKAGLLPEQKSFSLFSYISDWVRSLTKCFMPS